MGTIKKKAIVLFSGGLDSMLTVRILQRQGIDVEAINIRTQFACCGKTAGEMASYLGVPLSVIEADSSYYPVIRNPEFGYGRGANPCVDCRIFMFEIARTRMVESDADLVASGEVLGQRPNSQGRRDLDRIEVNSGLEGRLLRPLSAKLLRETTGEKEGWIDRESLYSFSGRSRKALIRLAKEFGFTHQHIPSPSTGCMLTQKTFAPRVFDLLEHHEDDERWQYELLKIGRHVRFSPETKVVIGRNEEESRTLQYIALQNQRPSVVLMLPDGFSGPSVVVVGEITEDGLQYAGCLLLKYAGNNSLTASVKKESNGVCVAMEIRSTGRADTVVTL